MFPMIGPSEGPSLAAARQSSVAPGTVPAMRPHNSAVSHWDGSPHRTRPHRSLQVSPTSPSRLLRAGQTSRCRRCGNRIDWYQRADGRPLALHPTELTTAHVPVGCRWHLSGGIAHPHDDGSDWCRIPHALVCTRHTPATRLDPHLQALRRQLAIHSRRLIDSGAFSPAPAHTTTSLHSHGDRPTHPVVRILLTCYLGRAPVEHIRCTAQTRHRHRCTQPVLAPDHPAGHWVLLPVHPGCSQAAQTEGPMAVYDLSHLPATEQLRWRTQRCPLHAATPGAADLALATWQPFDPLQHAEHIHTRLPHPPPHQPSQQ